MNFSFWMYVLRFLLKKQITNNISPVASIEIIIYICSGAILKLKLKLKCLKISIKMFLFFKTDTFAAKLIFAT